MLISLEPCRVVRHSCQRCRNCLPSSCPSRLRRGAHGPAGRERFTYRPEHSPSKPNRKPRHLQRTQKEMILCSFHTIMEDINGCWHQDSFSVIRCVFPSKYVPSGRVVTEILLQSCVVSLVEKYFLEPTQSILSLLPFQLVQPTQQRRKQRLFLHLPIPNRIHITSLCRPVRAVTN